MKSVSTPSVIKKTTMSIIYYIMNNDITNQATPKGDLLG